MLAHYLEVWPKTDQSVLDDLIVAVIAERIAKANGYSLGPSLGILQIMKNNSQEKSTIS